MEERGIADVEVDADAVRCADDRGPFGIGDIAIALEVREGRPIVERYVAERGLLAPDRGAVFPRDLVQRHRGFLIEAPDVRFREPAREQREIARFEWAETDRHRPNLSNW